jgi:hypothetical protein
MTVYGNALYTCAPEDIDYYFKMSMIFTCPICGLKTHGGTPEHGEEARCKGCDFLMISHGNNLTILGKG